MSHWIVLPVLLPMFAAALITFVGRRNADALHFDLAAGHGAAAGSGRRADARHHFR